MKTMQFCPYTGRPRHPDDIKSDPQGLLIVEPGEPMRPACRDHIDGQHVFDEMGQCYGNTCKAQAPEPSAALPDAESIAQFIRSVDGAHTMGAADLAERLHAWMSKPPAGHPEPPMAATIEEAARDVGKCLNERAGQGLDMRHVAMLVHHAQQPAVQGEPVAWRAKHQSGDWVLREAPTLPSTGIFTGEIEPLYTHPQPERVALSRDRIFEIAEEFGAFQYGDGQGGKRIGFARAIETEHGIKGAQQ